MKETRLPQSGVGQLGPVGQAPVTVAFEGNSDPEVFSLGFRLYFRGSDAMLYREETKSPMTWKSFLPFFVSYSGLSAPSTHSWRRGRMVSY